MKWITHLRPASLWTGCLALLLLVCAAPLAADSAVSAQAKPASAEMLERGQYLVTVAACNDCHTPWIMGPNGAEPDMSRMLSGHPSSMDLPPPPALPEGPWIALAAATNTAWAGPWGVSYTANLTPDRDTGLGKWTLRNFMDTIRTGRRLGRGRELLPPMPIPMYKNFNDQDLEAIFTYLQSIPAISNKVPAPSMPADSAAN